MAKSKLKTRNINFEIKEIDEATRTIKGYGSMFGNRDAYNDIIHSGAFKRTIEQRFPNNSIKFLWQHDQREPIGKFTKMFEDKSGLYLEAKFASTDTAEKAYTLVREGIIDGLSIGFTIIKEDFDTNTNINNIREVKLYEVSLVTFPANEEATVTEVKNQLQKEFNGLGLDEQEKILEYVEFVKSLSNPNSFDNIISEVKTNHVDEVTALDDAVLNEALAALKSIRTSEHLDVETGSLDADPLMHSLQEIKSKLSLEKIKNEYRNNKGDS